jgi:hypothetical protein
VIENMHSNLDDVNFGPSQLANEIHLS